MNPLIHCCERNQLIAGEASEFLMERKNQHDKVKYSEIYVQFTPSSGETKRRGSVE
jgi:hypothetical protein